MGDTGCDPGGYRFCSERGLAVAIFGCFAVHRCDRADDIFPHYAVPQATIQLGYGQAEPAPTDLFIYPSLPSGWAMVGARTGASRASAGVKRVL